MPDTRRIKMLDQRQTEQHRETEYARPELQHRINPQRMLPRGNQARQRNTTQTHSAHKGAEKNSQGCRRRADHQLQQLKPNDFVDQGRAPAPYEKDQ